MRSAYPPAPAPLVDALHVLLEAATATLSQVHPEALQLLDLLKTLSPQERTTLLGALEREVRARDASLAASDGSVGPLDHTAHLFVRVYDHDAPVPSGSPGVAFQSSLEGLIHLSAFPEHLQEPVLAGVVDGCAALSVDERALFVGVVAEVHRAIAQSLAENP